MQRYIFRAKIRKKRIIFQKVMHSEAFLTPVLFEKNDNSLIFA